MLRSACSAIPGFCTFAAPAQSRLLSAMSAFSSIQSSNGAFKFLLDGEWKESASGKTVPVLNPQTGEPAFQVQSCSKQEVDAAYAGAAAAQPAWARTPLWRRAETLHKAAEALRGMADGLAPLLVAEIAKPRKASHSEVIRSAELISYCAEEGVRYLGEGKLLNSDSFPGTDRNKLCLSSKVRTQT
jgi:glyceraldehyde-3-phosphate dehydrogenase (NADP+)